MNNVFCMECGTEFSDELKACPNCGCPVLKEESSANHKIKGNFFKHYGLPFLSLILGFTILILGVVLVSKATDIPTIEAQKYDVANYEFGADFYSQIYNASDVIVDELNAINSGIGTLSVSIERIAEIIYFTGGMIVIAIGLAVIANSILNFAKRKEYIQE